jgi:hypothetical protein
MGEENKIRDAADAVKGIVQAVPVYQDLIQSAAKKLGASLETIAAAVHAALLPVRGLVWGSEKVGEYLNAALETILKLKVAAKSCCYGIADSARNKRRYQSRAQAN